MGRRRLGIIDDGRRCGGRWAPVARGHIEDFLPAESAEVADDSGTTDDEREGRVKKEQRDKSEGRDRNEDRVFQHLSPEANSCCGDEGEDRRF